MSSACKQTIFLGKSLCCWRPIVFSEAYLIYMATLWYYEGNSSPRLVDWTMDKLVELRGIVYGCVRLVRLYVNLKDEISSDVNTYLLILYGSKI